jgi:phytoene synthase
MEISLSSRPSGRAGPAPAALAAAYDLCGRLTARYSRSFALAARLLPPPKRRAVHALYAFCRLSDDLVDSPAAQADPAAAARALAAWRAHALGPAASANPSSMEAPLTLQRCAQRPWVHSETLPSFSGMVADRGGGVGSSVALAFADARRRYAIPVRYAHQLLSGVGRDLARLRCARFAQVAGYAYGVASTVGLMSMHIIGFRGPAARYAARLGIALQLTNILRDIGEDWALGRCYLAADELAAFGLAERDLAAGRVTPAWRAFMRFQINRCQRLYAAALPGIALLHPDGRLAVAAAALFYRGILADIAAHDYDVFSRRAHLSALGKLACLPQALRAALVPAPAAPGASRLSDLIRPAALHHDRPA